MAYYYYLCMTYFRDLEIFCNKSMPNKSAHQTRLDRRPTKRVKILFWKIFPPDENAIFKMS